MKIYLSPSTVGRYGGGLKGNLSFLDRIIQERLDNSDFKSSFEELWLTLSYPPMYILPGIVGMEKNFFEFYNKLPNSRLNRRYKKIDITLRAPEFSEHFDKAEQDKYKNTFKIEKQYQKISDVDLAKIFIDKFLQAGQIIKEKLKKDDIFQVDTFNQVLEDLKTEITSDFLNSSSKEQKTQVVDEYIKRALDHRKKRTNANKPKDKPIRDLRVYYNGLPNKALYPYDYQFVEIFMNLLHKNGLMCPTYHHLYIQVGEKEDDCLKNSIPLENWYINGISVINYEDYKDKTEKEKEKFVFNVILRGLEDIFTIDNLDKSILDKVVNQIKKSGLDTELDWKTLENKNYHLRVTYFSKSMEDQCPIYFTLTDKLASKSKRFEIGRADKEQIYYWLQKISLTNSKIKVKSSDSVRADVWLKEKPRTMEFDIKEIMNKNGL